MWPDGRHTPTKILGPGSLERFGELADKGPPVSQLQLAFEVGEPGESLGSNGAQLCDEGFARLDDRGASAHELFVPDTKGVLTRGV